MVFRLLLLLLSLASALFPSSSQGAPNAFSIGVEVAPSASPAQWEAVPVVAGANLFAQTPTHRHYSLSRSPAETAKAVMDQMRANGFELIADAQSTSTEQTQTWKKHTQLVRFDIASAGVAWSRLTARVGQSL